MQVDEVQELRRLVRAASRCVGPCGQVHATRLSDVPGARTFFTSSSSAVLKSLRVSQDHHVIQLFVDAAEAHIRRNLDGGWLFINFCLRVVLTLLGLGVGLGTPCSSVSAPLFPRTVALYGVALASAWLDDALQDEHFLCRRKLDWSHLPSVLSLILSSLCKPVAVDSPSEGRSLALVVLDAFVHVLPKYGQEDLESFDPQEVIRYSWFVGPDVSWSSSFHGLVLDTPVALGSAETESCKSMRLVLFDVSLEQWLSNINTNSHTIGVDSCSIESSGAIGGAGPLRTWELSQFNHLADSLTKANIKVLACQKLVDTWISDHLHQLGVTVLSQLSLRHIEYVRLFSGAVPVSSLSMLPKSWDEVCGTVGSVEFRTICERRYAFIHPPHDSPEPSRRSCGGTTRITTLLVGAPDEHVLSELKLCIPQAVANLK